MRSPLSCLPAFLGLVASIALAAPQDPPKPIDLKVLYAGVLDAPRTADFKEFLSKTFSEVGAVELRTLDAKAAEGFDVVIVDAPTPFQKDGGYKSPEVPPLTTDFAKPAILMGAAGGKILNGLKIKLHWL